MSKYLRFIEITSLLPEAEKIAKQAFAEGAKKLFEENPNLKRFGWNQYAPGFNDGDPCVFTAHVDDCLINGSDPCGHDEDQDEDKPSKWPDITQKEEDALRDKVVEFVGPFDTFLEEMYGNGSRILVTAKGVKVEDYDGEY